MVTLDFLKNLMLCIAEFNAIYSIHMSDTVYKSFCYDKYILQHIKNYQKEIL